MSDGAGGGISLRDAGKGARAAGGSPRHHRAPLPVDRSVLWTPSRDPGAPDAPAATGPYELFLTRSTASRVGRHLAEAGRDSRFGFLLGRLYRCPETGVHYAVADRSLRAEEPFSEETPDPFLLRAWAACRSAFEEHGGILLGWYHSHYLLGLFLSEADREINARYFAQPWQCCLLVVPDPSRTLGALYRPSQADEPGGGEPGPFRELLAPEDVPESGPIPSAIGWKNYRPDRDVTRMTDDGSPEREEAPTVIRVMGEDSHRGSSMTLVLPENPKDDLRARLPLRGRQLVWLVAILAMLIGGYFGGMALFQSDEAVPVSTPSTSERPAPVPPEVQRFRQAATELQEAMLRYDERRQDFDLGRIGCELLGGGYAAADDAFIAVAGAYAGAGELADDSLTAAYERLVEEMNAINVHFDASTCPRPQ